MALTVASPRTSLLPAFARIRELAALPPNWDREGAERPTPEAVAAALYLIEAVASVHAPPRRTSVAPATSSPLPDGGLQVEWDGGGARIDVQANADGTYGYLLKYGSGPAARYEETAEAPLEDVISLIDRVLSA